MSRIAIIGGGSMGEALLSGQLTSFPVLVRVSPPRSQGEREELDAFEVLDRARSRADA